MFLNNYSSSWSRVSFLFSLWCYICWTTCKLKNVRLGGPKISKVKKKKTIPHLIGFRCIRSSKINYNFLKCINTRVSVDIWWQNWFNFGKIEIFLPHWNAVISLLGIVYCREPVVCQDNLIKIKLQDEILILCLVDYWYFLSHVDYPNS